MHIPVKKRRKFNITLFGVFNYTVVHNFRCEGWRKKEREEKQEFGLALESFFLLNKPYRRATKSQHFFEISSRKLSFQSKPKRAAPLP